jgi:hypothetical protein
MIPPSISLNATEKRQHVSVTEAHFGAQGATIEAKLQ